MAHSAVDQKKLVRKAHRVLDVHEEDTYVHEIEDGEVNKINHIKIKSH